MKKKLLLVVMAVAALTSCSNDDVVDVNNNNSTGISFRVSLDKAITRTGNVIKQENLKSFNVTAVDSNNENFFTNVSTILTGNSTWTTDSVYFWPSCKLAFFAYSPQTLAGIVDMTSPEKKISGFSPAQKVSKQKDLVISYNEGTKADNEKTGVAMNFKHALSQIEVKAKCSNSKVKIEILGVKLVNMATKADFTFPSVETNASYILSQDRWSNRSGENSHLNAYMIRGTNPVTLNATAQSIMFGENNFMLIPQRLTKWNDSIDAQKGAYLSVLCRISSLNDSNKEILVYPQPTADNDKKGRYAFSAVGIGTNWEPGKKYTYTLNFCDNGGGAGKLDPNPTDPTNPTDPSIDPDPIPGGNGGGSIMGNPITFTVTVDKWGEPDGEGNDITM
ncbi:fimbrillin family protein [uncultured Parabacteroides sp.]|uniref:fimbrillin family protein n=1 Tax=uncultured Parabacteroides sp. TaxID=512312 RepID=UPI00261DCD7C|nr:fimbrillin family protein [uncultured Parabacteroides sp.]